MGYILKIQKLFLKIKHPPVCISKLGKVERRNKKNKKTRAYFKLSLNIAREDRH
jgi:hypothetical protein